MNQPVPMFAPACLWVYFEMHNVSQVHASQSTCSGRLVQTLAQADASGHKNIFAHLQLSLKEPSRHHHGQTTWQNCAVGVHLYTNQKCCNVTICNVYWAARYNTWFLIKLTLKGVVFSVYV